MPPKPPQESLRNKKTDPVSEVRGSTSALRTAAETGTSRFSSSGATTVIRFDKRVTLLVLLPLAFLTIFGGCGGKEIVAPQSGTLEIDVSPDGIGAGWLLEKRGKSYSGVEDTILVDIPAGKYALTWQPVDGWKRPLPNPVELRLEKDSKATFSGTYVPNSSGVVAIDATPDDIDAPWTLTEPDGKRKNGVRDATLKDQAAGKYRLKWGDVEGYSTPDSLELTLEPGGDVRFAGTYISKEVPRGTIVLDPNPDSINAPWSLSGPFEDSGAGRKELTDIPVGAYQVTWGDVAGWSTPSPASENLSAQDTLVLSGEYLQLVGSLTIDPKPEAVNDAPWTLEYGGGAQTDGNGRDTLSNLPVGDYTLTWGSISGWRTPAPDVGKLEAGQTKTLTGWYVEDQASAGDGKIISVETGFKEGDTVTLTGELLGDHGNLDTVWFTGSPAWRSWLEAYGPDETTPITSNDAGSATVDLNTPPGTFVKAALSAGTPPRIIRRTCGKYASYPVFDMSINESGAPHEEVPIMTTWKRGFVYDFGDGVMKSRVLLSYKLFAKAVACTDGTPLTWLGMKNTLWCSKDTGKAHYYFCGSSYTAFGWDIQAAEPLGAGAQGIYASPVDCGQSVPYFEARIKTGYGVWGRATEWRDSGDFLGDQGIYRMTNWKDGSTPTFDGTYTQTKEGRLIYGTPENINCPCADRSAYDEYRIGAVGWNGMVNIQNVNPGNGDTCAGNTVINWVTDIYIQTGTQARVMIGDNADWLRCTKTELQKPLSWSYSDPSSGGNGANTITFEANYGTWFQKSDTVYLHIVTDSGDVVSYNTPISLQ